MPDLADVSPFEPRGGWYLLPSDEYLVKWRSVKKTRNGTLHRPSCPYALERDNSWDVPNNGLVRLWWESPNMVIDRNSPPKIPGFMRFCSHCVVTKPSHALGKAFVRDGAVE